MILNFTFLLYFKRFDMENELEKTLKKLNLRETTKKEIIVSLFVYSTVNK